MKQFEPFYRPLLPGHTTVITLQPPVIPARKRIDVPIDVTEVSKKFFFESDDELNAGIVIGIKMEVAGIIILKDQFGNQTNISDAPSRYCVISIPNQEDEYILDEYPLEALQGRYFDTGFSIPVRCTMRIDPIAGKLNWKGGFIQSVPGAPAFSGIVPLSVTYIPQGMLKGG